MNPFGLEWVLWSCVRCRRQRYTIRWWAERSGCDHGRSWPTSDSMRQWEHPGETPAPLPEWVRDLALEQLL